MAAQRKKGPVNQKRFVVLLDGDGLFDKKLSEIVRKEAPDIIFQTLSTLEIKSKSALASALGVTNDRLAGLLKDLGILSVFDEIRKHGKKRSPSQ